MIKRVRDWMRPIVQALLLIIVFFIPNVINVAGKIQSIFENTTINFDNAKYFYIMKMGNGLIGVIFMLLILFKFVRASNENHCLNKGNYFHEHSYLGYWLCANVLGYKKCSLVRVPIYMQFKLVLRDTFNEYLIGQYEDYHCVDDEVVEIKGLSDSYTSSVNLVLADTYPILKGMLPASTSNLSTIWVIRTDSVKMIRTFSKMYCNSIREIVSGLPNNVEMINLYSTINPKHSFWIANNVFKMGGRCQVKALKVFPQSNKNGNWNFAEKGIVIYDER